MATITLYIGVDCDEWETEIRDVIEDVAGRVVVEVFADTGRVVVEGCNASVGEILRQLYHKLGLRATVVSETYGPPKFEFSSDDEDDNDEEDDDEDGDDTDDDDEEEDDEDGIVTDDEEDVDGEENKDDDDTDDEEDYFSC